MTKITQREMRHGIAVDDGLSSVVSVTSLYRAVYFRTEEAALGAFKLACQQGLDGMGKSIADWMGMTGAEYDSWMRNMTLPPMKKSPRQNDDSFVQRVGGMASQVQILSLPICRSSN